jgi:transposase InsO family protein
LKRAGKAEASQFTNLIKFVPYKIEKILTDNGIQFTNRVRDKHAFAHIFDRVCNEHAIAHRLTKVKHPRTNGQVERMNRTIQEATINKYFYKNYDELKEHLFYFLRAYNYEAVAIYKNIYI